MGPVNSKNRRSHTKVTEQDRAILELKRVRDNLTKYTVQHEAIAQREVEIARACLASGQKQRALLALRKKKHHEKLIEQTNAQLLNVEHLVHSIEFAVMQKDVTAGLEKGRNALVEINDSIAKYDVEKIMQDTEDAVAVQNELGEYLSRNLAPDDELAVIDELDLLFKQQTAAAVPTSPQITEPVPTVIQMPQVPTTEIKIPEPIAKPIEVAQEATNQNKENVESAREDEDTENEKELVAE